MAIATYAQVGALQNIPFDASLEVPKAYTLQKANLLYGVEPYRHVPLPPNPNELVRACAVAYFNEQVQGRDGVQRSLYKLYTEKKSESFTAAMGLQLVQVLQDQTQTPHEEGMGSLNEAVEWARENFRNYTITRLMNMQRHDPFVLHALLNRGLSVDNPSIIVAFWNTSKKWWLQWPEIPTTTDILRPGNGFYLPLMAQGGTEQAQVFEAMHRLSLYPFKETPKHIEEWSGVDTTVDSFKQAHQEVWKRVQDIFNTKATLSTPQTKQMSLQLRDPKTGPLRHWSDAEWRNARKEAVQQVYTPTVDATVAEGLYTQFFTDYQEDTFLHGVHQHDLRVNIKVWLHSSKMRYYFHIREMLGAPPVQGPKEKINEWRGRLVVYHVFHLLYNKPDSKIKKVVDHTFTPEFIMKKLRRLVDHAELFSKCALVSLACTVGHNQYSKLGALHLIENVEHPDLNDIKNIVQHFPEWTPGIHSDIRAHLIHARKFRTHWLRLARQANDESLKEERKMLVDKFEDLRRAWDSMWNLHRREVNAANLAPIANVMYTEDAYVTDVPLKLWEFIASEKISKDNPPSPSPNLQRRLNTSQKKFLECVLTDTEYRGWLDWLKPPGVPEGGDIYKYQVAMRPQPTDATMRWSVPTLEEYKLHFDDKERVSEYSTLFYDNEMARLRGWMADGDAENNDALTLRSFAKEDDPASALRMPHRNDLLPRMKVRGAYTEEDCFRYEYVHGWKDEWFPPSEFGMVITNPTTESTEAQADRCQQQGKFIILWEHSELRYEKSLTLRDILNQFAKQNRNSLLSGKTKSHRKAWAWYLGVGEQLFVNRPGLARWELTYTPDEHPYRGTIQYYLPFENVSRHLVYWSVPLRPTNNERTSEVEHRIPWLTRNDNLLNMFRHIVTDPLFKIRVPRLLQPQLERMESAECDGWWGTTAARMFLNWYRHRDAPDAATRLRLLDSDTDWTPINATTINTIEVVMDAAQYWFEDGVFVLTLQQLAHEMSKPVQAKQDEQAIDMNVKHDVQLLRESDDEKEDDIEDEEDDNKLEYITPSRIQVFYGLFEKVQDTDEPERRPEPGEKYTFRPRAFLADPRYKIEARIRGTGIRDRKLPDQIATFPSGTDFTMHTEYLFDRGDEKTGDDFAVAPSFEVANEYGESNYRTEYKRGLCRILFEVQIRLLGKNANEHEPWGARRFVCYQPMVLMEPLYEKQRLLLVPKTETVQYVSDMPFNDVRRPLRRGAGWSGVFDIVYGVLEDKMRLQSKPIDHVNPFQLANRHAKMNFVRQTLTSPWFTKLKPEKQEEVKQRLLSNSTVEAKIDANRLLNLGILPISDKQAELRMKGDDFVVPERADMTPEQWKEYQKALRDAEREERRKEKQEEDRIRQLAKKHKFEPDIGEVHRNARVPEARAENVGTKQSDDDDNTGQPVDINIEVVAKPEDDYIMVAVEPTEPGNELSEDEVDNTSSDEEDEGFVARRAHKRTRNVRTPSNDDEKDAMEGLGSLRI